MRHQGPKFGGTGPGAVQLDRDFPSVLCGPQPVEGAGGGGMGNCCAKGSETEDPPLFDLTGTNDPKAIAKDTCCEWQFVETPLVADLRPSLLGTV